MKQILQTMLLLSIMSIDGAGLPKMSFGNADTKQKKHRKGEKFETRIGDIVTFKPGYSCVNIGKETLKLTENAQWFQKGDLAKIINIEEIKTKNGWKYQKCTVRMENDYRSELTVGAAWLIIPAFKIGDTVEFKRTEARHQEGEQATITKIRNTRATNGQIFQMCTVRMENNDLITVSGEDMKLVKRNN